VKNGQLPLNATDLVPALVELTFRMAACVATEVGVNVTATEQELPGANDAVQVLLFVKRALLVALKLTAGVAKFSVPVPVLETPTVAVAGPPFGRKQVMVTGRTAESVSTGSGITPLPVKLTVRVVPATPPVLEVMVTVPGLEPAVAVGENNTPKLQVAVLASVPMQLLFTML
jgi:hypothetical protein